MTASTAIGAAMIQAWMINRRLGETIPQGPRAYDFGGWFKVSLPLVVVAAAELMLQNTDVLVISRFMTPDDVAIYYASAKTMSLIMFVHFAVGSAVANRFSALNARGDMEQLRAFVRDSVNWTFWPSLLGAAIILALGKPLLWLFGPQFEAGYPVMFILVIGFLFRSAFGPAEVLLSMLGEHQICAAVLIDSQSLDEQLAQVKAEIGPPAQPLVPRCSVCNSPLQSLNREAANGRVPPYIWRTKKAFKYCPGCHRVYWAGTHWTAIQQQLQSWEPATDPPLVD